MPLFVTIFLFFSHVLLYVLLVKQQCISLLEIMARSAEGLQVRNLIDCMGVSA